MAVCKFIGLKSHSRLQLWPQITPDPALVPFLGELLPQMPYVELDLQSCPGKTQYTCATMVSSHEARLHYNGSFRGSSIGSAVEHSLSFLYAREKFASVRLSRHIFQ